VAGRKFQSKEFSPDKTWNAKKKIMQYRKFVLSLGDEGLQEAELNRFLRGHRILKVEHLFLEAELQWVFLVSYLDGEQKETAPIPRRNEQKKFEPEKELDKEQLERYQRYAEIRLNLAHKYAVKAYVVFTNRELGELAKFDKLGVGELRQVEGVGEARISQYGMEFLELLNSNEKSGESDAVGGDSGQPF